MSRSRVNNQQRKRDKRRRQNQRLVRTTTRGTSPIATALVDASTQYEWEADANTSCSNNYDAADEFFRAYYELKAADSDMPASAEGSVEYQQDSDDCTPTDEETADNHTQADSQPSSVRAEVQNEETSNDSPRSNTLVEGDQNEISDFGTADYEHELPPVRVILTQLQAMK
jgi:hypothetical protein